jgi:hypothetical protein
VGEYRYTGDDKLAGILSPWQPLVNLQVAWAYLVSMKKLSPARVIKLICGPGPQVKRFPHRWNEHFKIVTFKRTIRQLLNIIAADIDGLRLPSMFI